MFRYLVLALPLVLSATVIGAADKEQDRLENCGVVMEEVLTLPDSIPQELLEKAECVVVIPSVMKVAVGIGGSYGRGAMVCRAGSVGFQLGGAATDLVLLVMNSRGVDALLRTKVTLGGTLSVAAGPKGREATASTDVSLRAEILSYSRSRGLFAGMALEGVSLRPDDDASAEIYGRKITARQIVTGRKVAVPPSGRRLVDVLRKNASTNESKRMTSR
jgi:lipid-binding SYLF domain-containing protein